MRHLFATRGLRSSFLRIDASKFLYSFLIYAMLRLLCWWWKEEKTSKFERTFKQSTLKFRCAGRQFFLSLWDGSCIAIRLITHSWPPHSMNRRLKTLRRRSGSRRRLLHVLFTEVRYHRRWLNIIRTVRGTFLRDLHYKHTHTQPTTLTNF